MLRTLRTVFNLAVRRIDGGTGKIRWRAITRGRQCRWLRRLEKIERLKVAADALRVSRNLANVLRRQASPDPGRAQLPELDGELPPLAAL